MWLPPRGCILISLVNNNTETHIHTYTCTCICTCRHTNALVVCLTCVYLSMCVCVCVCTRESSSPLFCFVRARAPKGLRFSPCHLPLSDLDTTAPRACASALAGPAAAPDAPGMAPATTECRAPGSASAPPPPSQASSLAAPVPSVPRGILVLLAACCALGAPPFPVKGMAHALMACMARASANAMRTGRGPRAIHVPPGTGVRTVPNLVLATHGPATAMGSVTVQWVACVWRAGAQQTVTVRVPEGPTVSAVAMGLVAKMPLVCATRWKLQVSLSLSLPPCVPPSLSLSLSRCAWACRGLRQSDSK